MLSPALPLSSPTFVSKSINDAYHNTCTSDCERLNKAKESTIEG